MEVCERQAEDSWLLREENRLNAAVILPGAEVILPLAEIYDRVEFPASNMPPRSRPSQA